MKSELWAGKIACICASLPGGSPAELHSAPTEGDLGFDLTTFADNGPWPEVPKRPTRTGRVANGYEEPRIEDGITGAATVRRRKNLAAGRKSGGPMTVGQRPSEGKAIGLSREGFGRQTCRRRGSESGQSAVPGPGLDSFVSRTTRNRFRRVPRVIPRSSEAFNWLPPVWARTRGRSSCSISDKASA